MARCRLNEEGAVCLRDILESFNSSIKEEQAWALCYQCARCFKDAIDNNGINKCYPITDVDHILLQSDGSIHSNTVFAGGGTNTSSGPERRPATSEHELVVGLGIAIFNALDMGYSYGEERAISRDLEQLIDLMTSGDESCEIEGEPHQETDDEGIERDSECDDLQNQPRGGISIDRVLELCSVRVDGGCRQTADLHYRAVCRALVAEALELATFLDKVSTGTGEMRLLDRETCRDLDQLNFQDWARFWVQVIGELRMGVKLKKVDRSRTPIEFEMTPYEILMDDIRSRRYTLRKIMVDGDIPQRVKKDAHALILEFIRSRPPLRKVSERKLAPLKRAPTPREQLLDSIKKGQPLRPTVMRCRSSRHTVLTPVQNDAPKKKEDGEKDKPTRRLIKVDFSVLQVDDDDDDDDDDDEAREVKTKENGEAGKTNGSSPGYPWRRTGSRTHHITQDEYHHFCDTALESYDLATQCPSRRVSMRRHTLSAFAPDAGCCRSVPQSRPASRQSTDTDALSEFGVTCRDGGSLNWSRTSLQDELIGSRQWQEAMSLDDRLSLTLEEIVHIRSVLTKAELEALPVEGHVKEDVERRKVCFLCLKTRFGLFGPWGQRCKLCKRTVCARCYTKMRIPTEHFSNVPVVLLSPSLMSSPEDEVKDSFPRSLVSRLVQPQGSISETGSVSGERASVGSAPSSPGPGRRNIQTSSAPGSRVESSLSMAPSPGQSPGTPDRRSRMSRARTLGRPSVSDRLRGMQMIVCHDCKIMVIQIIKSSRTSRSAIRNNAIRNLTLNISPVY